MFRTDDVRVESVRPLLPPAILMEEIPLTEAASRTVALGRDAVARVLRGQDHRLLVVVGPCSIHDPDAAREYAGRLKAQADRLGDRLLVVMRTYFEKPRTVVGWKGLINDPHLDGSFRINEGLRIARGLLRDLAEMGLPGGTEFLDPISPQFVADLVAWGAIGARTTESQVHRELASGLSMPIGFKNGTAGSVKVAVEAVRSARHPHRFLGVTKEGISAIVATRGNPDTHVILRGGTRPNHDAASVAAAAALLAESGLEPRVMVDCSHGNSGKDHVRQRAVASEVAGQVAAGSSAVMGVMLESFLVEGRQELEDPDRVRGKSITDACMGWEATEDVLEELARAVEASARVTAG